VIFPGHVALAILGSHLLGTDLHTTVAATVAPDLIDKSAVHLFAATPSGRYIMHGIPAGLAGAGLAALIGGPRIGVSWLVGHLLHLLGDGAEVPWWFPLRAYKFPERREVDDILTDILRTSRGRRSLALEFALLGFSLLALCSSATSER
jgi:hypothetical protein